MKKPQSDFGFMVEPYGPCTEIFFNDGTSLLEIGNIVSIEYDKKGNYITPSHIKQFFNYVLEGNMKISNINVYVTVKLSSMSYITLNKETVLVTLYDIYNNEIKMECAQHCVLQHAGGEKKKDLFFL